MEGLPFLHIPNSFSAMKMAYNFLCDCEKYIKTHYIHQSQ